MTQPCLLASIKIEIYFDLYLDGDRQPVLSGWTELPTRYCFNRFLVEAPDKERTTLTCSTSPLIATIHDRLVVPWNVALALAAGWAGCNDGLAF
jgi:hypothetical protein